MAGGNIVITKTVNRTTFEVDKGSYQKTLRAIKSVKKEWEKAGAVASSPKNSPAKAYNKAAAEMRLVNKRLEETRRKEEKKSTDHSIALAKKEARAKEAVAKQSAARIKQTVGQMTTNNPETAKMRKFYQQQEREAAKAQKAAARKQQSGPLQIRKINSMQLPPRGGTATGMVGNPNNIYSPDRVAAQNRQMAVGIRAQSQAQDKAAKAAEKQQRNAAAQQARVADVMAQQRIRLSSKYGDNYHQTLGRGSNGEGIQDLNNKFRAGAISAGQYRQSIQGLERQFRSTQSAAVGFGSVLEDVRSGLVGVGAAYGVFNTGASIIKQGQFFQGLDATMLMVSSSSEEAAERIQFVRDQSMRLGLSLKEASQGYVQMSIAADGVLDKNQANDLFKSFSEYSTALQVDPVKFQRGITAIQQMMGKGQIMAEELKGQ